ncbi:hypothetical protein DPMN_012244 [Dreissena polymorpha]|uniref:CCHC-type domain-containing protein n=1 Tax=Dreissena polymorpha TaxID=45954 RepID=A0A9D4N1Z4_DREPO|nr:hypothetical protein DPMN_012244 [Dreissena polymorpha]
MNSRIKVLEKEREQYQINAVQKQQGNDYRQQQQGNDYIQQQQGNEYAGNTGIYARGMNQGFRLTGNRGPRHFRGVRGRFQERRPYRGHGRGNNSYRPRRPLGSNTFRPNIQCFQCNKFGHFASNCPLNE